MSVGPASPSELDPPVLEPVTEPVLDPVVLVPEMEPVLEPVALEPEPEVEPDVDPELDPAVVEPDTEPLLDPAAPEPDVEPVDPEPLVMPFPLIVLPLDEPGLPEPPLEQATAPTSTPREAAMPKIFVRTSVCLSYSEPCQLADSLSRVGLNCHPIPRNVPRRLNE